MTRITRTLVLAVAFGGPLTLAATPVDGGGGAPTPARPASPESGWLFDDGTGTAAADAFGTRDGTLEGGMGDSNWMTGTPVGDAGNTALGFDGANDRVHVSDAGIVSHADNSTVSAWFWWDDPLARKQFSIYNERDECSFNIYTLHVERRSGAENGLTFAIFDRSTPAPCGFGGWQTVSVPIETIATDAWHHAVGVLDENEGLKLYLDGQLVATSPDDTMPYSGGTGLTTIGHLHTLAYDSYWSGLIDEVAVFNEALGDEEVLWLYQNSIRGLLCTSDFDDTGGTDVGDLLAVLGAWGSSDPLYDIAPAGGDGIVNVQDLLALLAAWGPCS